jgi:alkyl hydroperoxide reductase subunit AhpC
MPLIGQTAPDFTAKAVVGTQIVDYTLSKNWKDGAYTLLFFYPKDFTFVCPTEVIAFSERMHEFEKRNCRVVAVSTDSADVHWAWKNTPRNKGGVGDIAYPMVADTTKAIANAYDVVRASDGVAFRGQFLIDAHGRVRHLLVNDTPIGRSVNEALRLLDAVQYHELHGEVCPADWHAGEKGIKDNHEDAQEYFAAVQA